jgi:hypothetical protein
VFPVLCPGPFPLESWKVGGVPSLEAAGVFSLLDPAMFVRDFAMGSSWCRTCHGVVASILG